MSGMHKELPLKYQLFDKEISLPFHRTYFDVVPLDLRKELLCFVARGEENDGIKNYINVLAKDGEQGYIDCAFNPIWDSKHLIVETRINYRCKYLLLLTLYQLFKIGHTEKKQIIKFYKNLGFVLGQTYDCRYFDIDRNSQFIKRFVFYKKI